MLTRSIDAYFIDDMLVPLMVWECYPSAQRANSSTLRELAAAAESASESDILNRAIRKDQLFTLAPAHAVMSTVRPCYLVRGGGVAPRFPALLGKMSATNKRYRLLKELQAHMSRQVSANKVRSFSVFF
jgi:replication factor C subunit 1